MRPRASLAALFFLLAGTLLAAGPKPRITLELVTERGFPITGGQEWIKALGSLDLADVRIRSGMPGDELKVEKLPGSTPAYKVVGILGVDNRLRVTGGRRFSIQEIGGIRKWLEELGDQGVAGVTERKIAFGLLSDQLDLVQEDLKRPVDFATKDQPLQDLLDKFKRRLNVPFAVDVSAETVLAETRSLDDLQGVTSGTALAILLRPAGLVLEPQRPPGGRLQYRIGRAAPGLEFWPLGWTTEESPRKLVPALFETINVAIEDTPVSDVMKIVFDRLKTPVFYDHNAMALAGIDPTKVMAALPEKRLPYILILNKVLSQAKLKQELRVDEAGKPLVWVTTVARS